MFEIFQLLIFPKLVVYNDVQPVNAELRFELNINRGVSMEGIRFHWIIGS